MKLGYKIALGVFAGVSLYVIYKVLTPRIFEPSYTLDTSGGHKVIKINNGMVTINDPNPDIQQGGTLDGGWTYSIYKNMFNNMLVIEFVKGSRKSSHELYQV